jgi:hypothetical protein
MLCKKQAGEYRDRMVAAAFVGWQMGAGQKTTFDEYLRKIGLGDKPRKMSKEEIAAEIKRANEIADKIIEADLGARNI